MTHSKADLRTKVTLTENSVVVCWDKGNVVVLLLSVMVFHGDYDGVLLEI